MDYNKLLENYRDPDIIKEIVSNIKSLPKHPMTLMEVCGTHTMAIGKAGIRSLIPEWIRLVSGPGCPVCVTSAKEIEQMLKLSSIEDVTVVTFGDLMRVPSKSGTLQHMKSNGADIRVVYSSFDTLNIAMSLPERKVVFLGVGFETTAPTIAATVLKAKEEGIENFFVFSAHKLIPPAIEILMEDPDLKIDGLIAPGHVSVVIGLSPYEKLAQKHKRPFVITGFEPVDILQGILMLARQIVEGRSAAEIQYKRVVSPDGQPAARKVMNDIFEPCDAEWRGLGIIPGSGLKLRHEWERYDAKKEFDLSVSDVDDPPGCRCGDVLKGIISPKECALFAKVCTPISPVGPCMVSSEGSCAAAYKYEREV